MIKKFVLWLDNKKIIFISCVLGFLFSFCLCVMGRNYCEATQNLIANKIIRFHVLANSDKKSDQELKLKVRDGILKKLEPEFKKAKNKSETREILKKNLDEIKIEADKILKENNCEYKTKVSLAYDYFPTRQYGDIKFLPGKYETIKIIIGKGRGHNWCCVMFPPLCFMDMTKKVVPKNLKNKFKNILSEDEFKLINCENEKKSIKVKFKIVEAWQNFSLKNKLAKKN